MNEQICKSHATVLDVTRFNEYCPWIIVQASDCKRDLCYVNLNTSFHYSMIWVLSVYYVFLEGVCSTPVGADPKRCRFVHAVTVHAEKKRIPSNDLKNVGQPWPSVALCYFESLKINYFVCTWISWHKRLISLKCMNSDHVILQTTKKNIFSSIPLCDVIMTLKLNKKSFSPSFFFYQLITWRLLP